MPESKILVVDDEKTVVEIHKKLLEKRGYSVVVAYNGSEALSKVASDYDAILCDVRDGAFVFAKTGDARVADTLH